MLVNTIQTPSKYNMLLEAGVVVHTLDLPGRPFLTVYAASFVAIYKGTLTKYIAEVFPFEVSWPLEAQTDFDALEEAKRLTKTYFQNVVDAI